MTAPRRWRDIFQSWTPNWLSERPGQFAGSTVGYRVLWVLHATIDKLTEGLVQAFLLSLPGYGSPSNLNLIGQSRGILRGASDTNASYAARLAAFRQTWRLAGTRIALATQIHLTTTGFPQVDIVNRAGTWTRVGADGTVTQFRGVHWNWDGTSNPERASYWSDLWVIISYGVHNRSGTIGGLASIPDRPVETLGHTQGYLTVTDVDRLRSAISTWKSTTSRVRAVIWTPVGRFDPTNSATLPDGTWGRWGKVSGGVTVPARDLSLRYWEPN